MGGAGIEGKGKKPAGRGGGQESGRRDEMQILGMSLRAWGEDERHVAGL